MEILQHVDKFLYLAQDNFIFSLLLGFLFSYIESFIPMIPIMVVGAANGAIHGLAVGFGITWIGSCLGAFSVFIILKHIMGRKFFTKIMEKNNRFNKMIFKVKKSDFKFLFVFYTLPFLPSSLTTLAASYCRIDIKRFLPPMIAGKFLMLFLVSYVGSDYKNFINKPIKMIIAIVVIVIVYLLGKKIEAKMSI